MNKKKITRGIGIMAFLVLFVSLISYFSSLSNAASFDGISNGTSYNYKITAGKTGSAAGKGSSESYNITITMSSEPIGKAGNENYNATIGYLRASRAAKPPKAPENITINISDNDDGVYNVSLEWEPVPEATTYKIYSSTSATENFELIEETIRTNFTDDNATDAEVKFYKIASVNEGFENVSDDLYAKVTYKLKRKEGSNTRNWISFPINNTMYKTANDFLQSMTNVTSIVRWNSSSQYSVACNKASCPEIGGGGCTQTNCDFYIKPGEMYEVNIKGDAPEMVNWTNFGKALAPVEVQLYNVPETYSLNHVSVPANTTIVSAQELLTSMNSQGSISMVRTWDAQTQSTYSRIDIRGGMGVNFEVKLHEGYEIVALQSFTWKQE